MYLGVAKRFPSVKFVNSHVFTAGLHRRIYEFPVFSIQRTENLADHLNLYRCKAVWRCRVVAQQWVGCEITQIRILDDAIDDSVKTIALIQDLVVNQIRPRRSWDEVG